MMGRSHPVPAASRWLAHLLRAAEGVSRPGERFVDDLAFDAAAVLQLAKRERVAALLHLGFVNGRIGDALPACFRNGCAAFYDTTRRKNLVALDTGHRILKALAGERIAAAPLDEWSLLQDPAGYHADPGARPMERLALVVRESDRERAEDVIARLGYRRTTRREAAIRGGHELAFRRNEAGADLFVELHWAWPAFATPRCCFATSGDEFLEGLCDTTVSGGHRATRFGTLLVAASHAVPHGVGSWIWLDDLYRVIAAAPMDWKGVASGARRWRVRGLLYAGLAATRKLFRAPIPPDVLDALAPGPVRRRLLHRSLATARRDSRAAGVAQLLFGGNWWDTARTLVRSSAPPPFAWSDGRGRPAPTHVTLSHPLRVVLPPPENP